MSILVHIKTPVTQNNAGYGYIKDADDHLILTTVARPASPLDVRPRLHKELATELVRVLNNVNELVEAAKEHIKAQELPLLSEAMIFKRQAAEARLRQAIAAMQQYKENLASAWQNLNQCMRSN